MNENLFTGRQILELKKKQIHIWIQKKSTDTVENGNSDPKRQKINGTPRVVSNCLIYFCTNDWFHSPFWLIAMRIEFLLNPAIILETPQFVFQSEQDIDRKGENCQTNTHKRWTHSNQVEFQVLVPFFFHTSKFTMPTTKCSKWKFTSTKESHGCILLFFLFR